MSCRDDIHIGCRWMQIVQSSPDGWPRSGTNLIKTTNDNNNTYIYIKINLDYS